MRLIIQFFSFLVLLLVVVGMSWYFLERVHVLQTSFATDLAFRLFSTQEENATVNSIENDSLLLDQLRLETKQEQLKAMEYEINRQKELLDTRTKELAKEVSFIEAEKKALEEKKKSINEISNINDNKNERVKEVALSLMNMPPKNAVDILLVFNDDLMIDTLQAVNKLSEEQGEASVVPFWLSLMDAKRAGDVQKKLINR